MTDPFDDTDEMVGEEWPTFYTPVPVWVLLCGCSAQAYRMYAFLAEHINNRTPGQRIAFPSQKAIARVLRLKDYRDVARYRDELAELGAIRFEPFRYAGGMRRRYRYWVRFNPPEGYAGLLSLGEFYEANPDVKASRTQTIKGAALEETAGQCGGGKKPTSEGGENPTPQGGESPTAQQLDQEQPDPVEPDDGDALAARSGGDGRRPSTGSYLAGPVENSGCAASSKDGPSDSQQQGTAPVRRGQKSSSKRKARHSREQRAQVLAVRAYFPAELNAPDIRDLSDAILAALAEGRPESRTVAQIGARIGRRWYTHGWAAKVAAGETIQRPVGVARDLVRPYSGDDRWSCANPRCDEGVDADDQSACATCPERIADRRAERRQKADREAPREHPPVSDPAATVPTPRFAPVVGAARGTCAKCPIPIILVGPALEDGLCRECRHEAATTDTCMTPAPF